MQVASFPWDPPPPAPAPAPAPAAAAPPPTTAAPAASAQQAAAPSYTQAQLSPTPNTQSLPVSNGLPGPVSQAVNGHQLKSELNTNPDTVIKQEPGATGNGVTPPQFGAVGGGPQSVAAQRAMSQLQNQYGSRAAASISAIQGFGQGAQAGQGQGPSVASRPAAGGAPPQAGARPPQAAQYSQQIAAQTAATLQQQQQQQQRPGQPPAPFPGQRPASQNGFQQSQVDGAGDGYEGVLLRRDGNGHTTELGRVEVDRILHQHIAARAKEMEGGGLMLPLKEATKHKSIAHKSGLSGPSGFDGIDDELKREDPLDEEAINSDLDDPDEVDIAEEDDDENITQVMLCMYDKVQRVKNKWYCLSYCLSRP